MDDRRLKIMNKKRDHMNWISVTDSLPSMPSDKCGITVLVAVYDSVYEEICPGRGYDVMTMMFDGTNFLEYIVGKNYGFYIPAGDPVTHWMYLPEPPNLLCSCGCGDPYHQLEDDMSTEMMVLAMEGRRGSSDETPIELHTQITNEDRHWRNQV